MTRGARPSQRLAQVRLGRCCCSPSSVRGSSPPTSTTTPAASGPIRWLGAQFGYSLLWTMIPTTIALVVVQEMAVQDGRGHRQGPERPDSGGVRVSHHVLPDARAHRDQLRQRHGGVRGRGQQPGAVPRLTKYIVVPLSAGDSRLAAGRAGHVPQRSKKSSCVASAFYVSLHHRGPARAPGLEGGGGRAR